MVSKTDLHVKEQGKNIKYAVVENQRFSDSQLQHSLGIPDISKDITLETDTEKVLKEIAELPFNLKSQFLKRQKNSRTKLFSNEQMKKLWKIFIANALFGKSKKTKRTVKLLQDFGRGKNSLIDMETLFDISGLLWKHKDIVLDISNRELFSENLAIICEIVEQLESKVQFLEETEKKEDIERQVQEKIETLFLLFKESLKLINKESDYNQIDDPIKTLNNFFSNYYKIMSSKQYWKKNNHFFNFSILIDNLEEEFALKPELIYKCIKGIELFDAEKQHIDTDNIMFPKHDLALRLFKYLKYGDETCIAENFESYAKTKKIEFFIEYIKKSSSENQASKDYQDKKNFIEAYEKLEHRDIICLARAGLDEFRISGTEFLEDPNFLDCYKKMIRSCSLSGLISAVETSSRHFSGLLGPVVKRYIKLVEEQLGQIGECSAGWNIVDDENKYRGYRYVEHIRTRLLFILSRFAKFLTEELQMKFMSVFSGISLLDIAMEQVDECISEDEIYMENCNSISSLFCSHGLNSSAKKILVENMKKIVPEKIDRIRVLFNILNIALANGELSQVSLDDYNEKFYIYEARRNYYDKEGFISRENISEEDILNCIKIIDDLNKENSLLILESYNQMTNLLKKVCKRMEDNDHNIKIGFYKRLKKIFVESLDEMESTMIKTGTVEHMATLLYYSDITVARTNRFVDNLVKERFWEISDFINQLQEKRNSLIKQTEENKLPYKVLAGNGILFMTFYILLRMSRIKTEQPEQYNKQKKLLIDFIAKDRGFLIANYINRNIKEQCSFDISSFVLFLSSLYRNQPIFIDKSIDSSHMEFMLKKALDCFYTGNKNEKAVLSKFFTSQGESFLKIPKKKETATLSALVKKIFGAVGLSIAVDDRSEETNDFVDIFW